MNVGLRKLSANLQAQLTALDSIARLVAVAGGIYAAVTRPRARDGVPGYHDRVGNTSIFAAFRAAKKKPLHPGIPEAVAFY